MANWTTSAILLLTCWFFPWKHSSEKGSDKIENALSCDIVVDAGPDTNVCYPGGMLGLLGSIEGNYVFFQWTPTNGLNSAFILHPTANITGPITYTLTGYAADSNNPDLIMNGDFQAGNTGFTSDYIYKPDLPNVQNELVPEGTYTVVNNPNLVHTGFNPCSDHTGGGGNMLVVNGASTIVNIWCQTVAVTPNTWYNVSAWVASVSQGSPAVLKFSINGTQIGNTVTAPFNACQWKLFNANWNSGNNTTATICIVNLNLAGGGNDFAIDDISMVGLCAVEDEVTVTLYDEVAPDPEIDGPQFICAGETATYYAYFPPVPPILTYHWIVPSGATLISGQGTTQVTIRWDDPQDASLCLMIKTRCDQNEGCYDVTVGDVPDLPLISAPNTLCPGETTTLYTPENGPDDTYEWIVPPQVSIIDGAGTNEIEIEWAGAGEAEICLDVTNVCGTTENCTYLTLLPQSVRQFDTILCLGTSIIINGNTYGNGVWTGTETFTGINGCDSMVNINISEASSLEFMVTKTLCPGDSLFVQGTFQTQAGVYVDSFTTISNCDSLVITELIFSANDTTWINSTTCNPAEAGMTIVVINQGSCDSTVITQVLLLASDTTLISMFSCLPTDTGQVIQSLSNSVGCDSLVVTNTYLLQSDTTLFFQTSCNPSDTGVTTQILSNINGCDSIVVTTISYLQSDTTFLFMLTCMEGDTGTTSTLFTNSKGCDSLAILHLIFAGSPPTNYFGYTCSPLDSGLVVTHLINQFDCDSVISTYNVFISSDTTYLAGTSCDPLDTGVVVRLLSNKGGCDSLVITSTTLEPINNCVLQATYLVLQPQCYGDTAVVNVNIQIGLGPFNLLLVHLDEIGSFDFPSPGIYSFPFEIQGETRLILTSANGKQIIDTINVDNIQPLKIDAKVVNDYHGYGLACFGDSNGKIDVQLISNGTPPLTYLWSNGSDSTGLVNLKAGIYTLTVTDSHGCETSSSVMITEPSSMQYEFNVDEIKCFGEKGSATLSAIQGGVSPWMTLMDGNTFQTNFSYNNLTPGNHDLIITDQNGCSSEEQFILMQPESWSLRLGPDTLIPYGTNFEISAIIQGQPQGTLQFNWSDGQCDNCQSRTIEVVSTKIYVLTATDENGCTSADTITINVFTNRDIFIPNIFSPNGDGVNDRFIITSVADITEIEELSVYDRWGNLVFNKQHFLPNDPDVSWDGRLEGKELNIGVYTYKMIVVFKDDMKETRFGDVTLMR